MGNNRRDDLRNILTTLLLPAVSLWAGLGCGRKTVDIVVYHTNDIHGAVVERTASDGTRLGGLASLAALVSGESRPRILVDSGDWFMGTLEGRVRDGRAIVELMNLAGYDAATVGNQEFSFGPAKLQALAETARFPILAANLFTDGTEKQPGYLRPWIMKDVGGVRVGLFGVLTPELPRLVDPRMLKGLTVGDPIVHAKKAAAELRREGADIVIALSHLGWEPGTYGSRVGDKALADQVPDIDIIIGGHTHIRMPLSAAEKKSGPLVVQADKNLSLAGRVVMTFDLNGRKLLRAKADAVALDKDRHPPKPELESALRPIVAEADRIGSAKIGRALVGLTRSRWEESPLGDFVADCMRGKARTDIALINSGALRADFPAGTLTRRSLYQVLTYDDETVTMRLKGKELKEILEWGLSGPQGFLQVSGLRIGTFAAPADGKRLKSVAVGGKPLEDGRDYTVATIDYLMFGGEKYPHLAQAKVASHLGSFRSMVESCVREKSPLAPPGTPRIVKE